MDISKMLQYQEVDKQYTKLRNDFSSSPIAKKYVAVTSKIKAENDNILKLGAKADEIKSTAITNGDFFGDIKKQIEEMLKYVSESTGEEEISYYLKNADKINSSVQNVENLVNNSIKNIDNVQNAYLKTIEDLKADTQEYKTLSVEIAKQKEIFDKSTNELKSQLIALEKELSPKFIEAYKSVSSNKSINYPYIVEMKDEFCTGCGMQLNAFHKNNLASNGIIICPECGRILYIK